MLSQVKFKSFYWMLFAVLVVAPMVVFAGQDKASQGLDEQVQETKSDVLSIAAEMSPMVLRYVRF